MNWAVELSAAPVLWGLAALAAAASIAFGIFTAQPKALAALRLSAALLVAAAAAGPVVSLSEPVLAKPGLWILVDTGHSMRARGDGGTRLEVARRWLHSNREAISARAEASLFSASDRARRLGGLDRLADVKPSDAGFHAADVLLDAAGHPGRRPDRVWLLTDGNAVPSEDLERALAALAVPLDVLGVGPERRGAGVFFVEIKPPDFAFLHAKFPVETAVEAVGISGARLRLRFLKEEVSPQGRAWKEIDTRLLVAAGEDDVLRATFTATAASLGRERYRLEARREGGAVLAVREFGVEVIRQKYRIMYLAGRPSPEYASLREFLKSDPNHELVSFVILRNPESVALVPDRELSLIPFPAEEIFVSSLSQFDLFILENFSYRRFNLPVTHLNALKGFVAAGGALLVIGGEQAFGHGGYRGTPLEEVFPVALSASPADFEPALFQAKPVSPDHPLLALFDSPEENRRAWTEIAPLEGFARFAAVREGASVLVTHPSERTESGAPLPVVALRAYGRGKVLLIGTDSTWRWRLGAAGDLRLGNFYSKFWSRAVRYLTGSLDLSKVKFSPVPDKLPSREPASFPVRVFDDNFGPAPAEGLDLSVIWTPPSGPASAVWPKLRAPGSYAVELTGLQQGTHRLKAVARRAGRSWGEDEARFFWQPAGEEPPLDRAWIEKTARAGGGKAGTLRGAKTEELFGRLPPAREEFRSSRRLHPAAAPAWLWATLAALLLEWTIRRWRGHE